MRFPERAQRMVSVRLPVVYFEGSMAMVSLQNAKSGRKYRVAWLLGAYAGFLSRQWNLCVDDRLNVIENNGSTLIVKCHGKTIAMSADVAGSVKMEPI